MAYPQRSFKATKFDDESFWSGWRHVIQTSTLPFQLEIMKDTGRYDAFKLRHIPYYDEPYNWPVPNHLFWDSDIGKWIEAACYILDANEDPVLDTAVKELTEMIRSASQPDGYLNIHFTVVAPKERFTNFRDLHELYNLGHLIEGALAHHEHYKNDLLMEPILKYVDLVSRVIGPGENQLHTYPGHPEIELALIRLYDVTKNPRHLDLARYFIEERGNPKGQDGQHYYIWEARKRGERENEQPGCYPIKDSFWYHQAHEPIVDQQTIEGHSVRALYLLTAVADLVRVGGSRQSKELEIATKRLWDNMVEKKMYLTGGVGAMKQWEGFGIDYFLPQSTEEGGCYSETCASIAVMMTAERLLQIDLDGKYADIMELCLYNSVLTGISLDGKAFTYVNQLGSSDTDLSERHKWFQCACCPPNVSRLLGYLGGYLWTFNSEEKSRASINVHLYSSATLSFPVEGGEVKATQRTSWPWAGDIEFTIESPKSTEVDLALRIPAWASEWKIQPSPAEVKVVKGYLHLPASWVAKNPKFKLLIPLVPRLTSSHPLTNQSIVAVARGPIVYCVEDVDHPWVQDHFKSVVLDTSKGLEETQIRDKDGVFRGVGIKATDAGRFVDFDAYKPLPVASPAAGARLVLSARRNTLHFVPFYYRANRGGRGQMRVGLRRA